MEDYSNETNPKRLSVITDEKEEEAGGEDFLVEDNNIESTSPIFGSTVSANKSVRMQSMKALHLIDLSSGIGTKGDAYAAIEHVEAVSRRENKTLLHPMTVLFPESKVTAILGPSGSGKTTLLNFLTGTISAGVKAEGTVSLKGNVGFMPQEDHLHSFYTCRDYMLHYGYLTGMSDTFANQKLSMDLLVGLGLENHADTIVGDVFRKGLSGGQKRRLSVALESLSRPETLFLDEPTSGLDSESAFELVKFLVDYAKAPGRRVIMTIHQPNSFVWSMLENVILLSAGKLMYQGPRTEMESFFAQQGHPTPPNFNPADFYVSMVHEEFHKQEMSVDDWEVAFHQWERQHKPQQSSQRISMKSSTSPRRRSSLGFIGIIASNEIQMATSASDRGNIIQVLRALTRRNLLNLWKNPGTFGTRVFMYIMLSLCIGAMFWDLGKNKSQSGITARVSLIFYCVAFFVFMSIAVVPFSMMERGIVEKEVRNGYYHPAVYMLSQSVTSLFGTCVLALLTTIIIMLMTGLNEPVYYFLNMFLALNCAEALAYFVSFLVPHYIVGIAAVAGVYGLFMLFQGFMLVPDDFPSWLKWTNYVSFHTYSWRTFMYKEFANTDGFKLSNFTGVETGFGTGNEVLEFYQIDDIDPSFDMVVLVIYAVIIHLLSMIVLHIKQVMHRARQVDLGSAEELKLPHSEDVFEVNAA